MTAHSSEGAPLLAGVDGCRAGWLCLSRDSDGGMATARVFPTAAELVDATAAVVIAWDIPIGLSAKSRVADDDVLDAYAALWSAERIARGVAISLPDPPLRDALGLPMRIVY